MSAFPSRFLLVWSLSACAAWAQVAVPRVAVPPITGPEAPQAPEQSRLADPVAREARGVARNASDSGYEINPLGRETARLFHNTVFLSSNSVDSGWTGSTGTCLPGDTSVAYKQASLRRINWFRAMAGVPANVQLDTSFNQKAQQAALMMSAQGQLSHTPGAGWACHTSDGALAAQNANLALGRAGPEAIANGYMQDSGSNNAAVGHRRWLLYPQTQTMGIGDAVPPSRSGFSAANALWVFDGRFGSPRPSVRDEFVAWPPRGYVPYTTVYPRWSFSYPGANFSGATVRMTQDGVPLATRQEAVSVGIGEPTVVWFPGAYTDGMAWARPAADVTYSVTVDNVQVGGQSRSFNYTVVVFDPATTGGDTPDFRPRGAASLALGQQAPYSFNALASASQHQWRAVVVSGQPEVEGAEQSPGAVTSVASAGYSTVVSDVAASGSKAYRLAHPVHEDQMLVFNQTIVPRSHARLTFASRLGLSSPSQVAMVEVSDDQGASWQTLFSQAGQQSGNTSTFGESSFSQRSVSLSAHADQTLQLRFRYAVSSGIYYPQTSLGVGWYIDDIQFTDVDVVSDAATPQEAVDGQFTYAHHQPDALLQVRAAMYGYPGGWGKGLRVTSASIQPLSATECLFNWAERTVPGVLFPPTVSRTDVAPHTYRHYSGSNTYLLLSGTDAHLYFLSGSQVSDLGLQSAWLAVAGCQ